MAGNYTKMTEKINGHDVWKNDKYNYKKFVISLDKQKHWTIGAPKKSVGISGPSHISCPALVGNKWQYGGSKSKKFKKYKKSKPSIKGGNNISVKCLGLLYILYKKIYILKS